ncbi:MAG TPA: hypothetical protein VGF65_00025 [Mycobacterium sp.]|jgi:hypothetical protein
MTEDPKLPWCYAYPLGATVEFDGIQGKIMARSFANPMVYDVQVFGGELVKGLTSVRLVKLPTVTPPRVL